MNDAMSNIINTFEQFRFQFVCILSSENKIGDTKGETKRKKTARRDSKENRVLC